jgi:putative transposase
MLAGGILPLPPVFFARVAMIGVRGRGDYPPTREGLLKMDSVRHPPNHVHLLISEPSRGTISTVLQMLKQRVSREIRRHGKRLDRNQIGSVFAIIMEMPHALWQARFYDFNVYSEGKIKEKLNYMHANPVIRQLVKHPKDWPWSSWGY